MNFQRWKTAEKAQGVNEPTTARYSLHQPPWSRPKLQTMQPTVCTRSDQTQIRGSSGGFQTLPWETFCSSRVAVGQRGRSSSVSPRCRLSVCAAAIKLTAADPYCRRRRGAKRRSLNITPVSMRYKIFVINSLEMYHKQIINKQTYIFAVNMSSKLLCCETVNRWIRN